MQESTTKRIVISDASYDTIVQMVHYYETGKVTRIKFDNNERNSFQEQQIELSDLDGLLSIWKIAHRYNDPNLLRTCQKKIESLLYEHHQQ